jgi:hypothetical protein
MSYTRARPFWVDYPDLSTIVRAQDTEKWDKAAYDLKTVERDVRDYGVGVGTGDATIDTAAFQAGLTDAAGSTLLIPGITLLLSSEGSYAANVLGTIRIRGNGANSILKAVGASNKALHISGTAGNTSPLLSIDNIQIQSATSGTCPAPSR